VPRYRRLIHLGCYGLSIVAIVLTLSRGGWAALVAGHAVWFFYMNRQILALGIAALVLAGTVAFPLLPENVRDRLERVTTEGPVDLSRQARGVGKIQGSAAFRIVMHWIALEMLWDSPLWGHGVHSFVMLSPHYGAKYGMGKPKTSHSLFVKLAGETGLIGLSILFWICIRVRRLGRALWREYDDDHVIGVLLLAVGATIITFSLAGDGFLTTHIVSGFFWLLYGTCVRRFIVGDEIAEEDDFLEEHAVAA
jgi:O-antigen ligase